MSDDERVYLPRLQARLIEARVPPKDVPPYLRLWSACISGKLPAHRTASGRIYVLESDLPAIMSVLGLRARKGAGAHAA